MTEDSVAASDDRSAGAMLRAARERQGLHIAALAAAIKVPQAKLEALEAGRYDELTDATFVRALANSICRVLKIDPKPVLDQLPAVHSTLLERAEHDLRAPFRERPGREIDEAGPWHRPAFWVVAALLVAAAAFVLWPARMPFALKWPSLRGGDAASKPATAVASTSTTTAPAVPETPTEVKPDAAAIAPAAIAASPSPAVAPSVAADAASAAASAPNAAPSADATPGLAMVRAREPSWVEAHDARGNLLLSRTLQAGESVGLDGPLPLKLVIGNAPATEVTMRGKRVVLGAPNRDNVVKVELK